MRLREPKYSKCTNYKQRAKKYNLTNWKWKFERKKMQTLKSNTEIYIKVSWIELVETEVQLNNQCSKRKI